MTEEEWIEFVNKYSAIKTEKEEMREATVTSLILGLLIMLTILVLVL